jgi:hypothetical protein
MLRIILSFLLAVMIVGTADAQFHKGSRNPEKSMFGKTSVGRKEKKMKEPRAAHKARLKQEKNQQKLKKDYAKSVEENRKRSYDIQSPEVKERMNQNKKDVDARDKTRKKNLHESSKKAGKKYN